MNSKQFFAYFWEGRVSEIIMRTEEGEVLSTSPSDFHLMLDEFFLHKTGGLCSVDKCVKYARELGYVDEFGHAFYDGMEMNGWKLKNGNKCKNWKAAMRTWVRNNINDKYKKQKNTKHERF